MGTSLAAGIYGALTAANIRAGRSEFDSLLTGFHGAVGLVVVTSLIGIILAILAYRAVKTTKAATGTEEASANSVESIMKTDVYTLHTDQTVLEALQTFAERGISGAPIVNRDGALVGFLSDGDVMRYLSAAHPSSKLIYSFAIGADDDLEQAMSELADLNVMKLATHDVVTINASESIADAVAALSDAHLKKVPVVSGEEGRMVGIVSRSAINRLAIGNYLSQRVELLQAAGAQTS